VSADLAVLVADPDGIQRSADPAVFVIQACERAKVWLQEVLEHGDIGLIAETRAQAEAVRVYTMQKQLGKDAVFSATEIVRRAERGIGVAIRRGQEAGQIRKKGDDTRTDLRDQGADDTLVSPLAAAQVKNSSNLVPIYEMTDGVSDEDFELAIKDAKAEGNLTRANVIRKARHSLSPNSPGWVPDPGDRSPEASARRRELIRQYAAEGYSSRQISELIGTLDQTIRKIAADLGIEIRADEVMSNTRRHDSNHIVAQAVDALEGVVMGVGLVKIADLDQAECAAWATSITQSIRSLSRFATQLKEIVP
jgi:hypothetical protein